VSGEPPCPLCGGDSTRAFRVGDRNHEIGTQQFEYRRCGSCGGVFLANQPTDLGSYYPEDYYVLPSLAQLDEAANGESPRLALMEPVPPRGKLIEIGAGLGIFARAAQRAGLDVTAIEMDARCCRYLEEVVGVPAICSNEPERELAELGPVQAIALWHVLEHLARPWDVLARAADALERGGILALAMPNPESLQFRLLGARWAHVDAPRHLFLIPLDTLAAQAEKLGLRLSSVTTRDPAGRYWNRFGWEYAIRSHPARRGSSRRTRIAARLLALALAPLERRGMNGTTYTAVFVKS
jgi:SAM-dependent methyltransferase